MTNEQMKDEIDKMDYESMLRRFRCIPVLDPFFGAGTTGVVASDFNREYIGIELNPKDITLATKRIAVATKQMKLF